MTWHPRYVVQKAEGIGGPPIPEDEPCIVIRGQDALAEAMLLEYIDEYEQNAPEPDMRVLDDLREHLSWLRVWQFENQDIVKWADR